MKQNNWTTSCTQNEAESARETLIWLESVTEKETGKAQAGACVDVLPRCYSCRTRAAAGRGTRVGESITLTWRIHGRNVTWFPSHASCTLTRLEIRKVQLRVYFCQGGTKEFYQFCGQFFQTSHEESVRKCALFIKSWIEYDSKWGAR